MAGAGQRLPDRRGARAAVRADAGPDPGDLRRAHRRVRRRDPAALRARRARVRRPAADLQPGRLRGRAVGQRRARGDPLPAPRAAGPMPDTFSLQTAAGEIRPTDHLGHAPARSTWGGRGCAARTTRPATPDGARRADRRRAHAGAFSTSRSATRSARSGSADERELERARPRRRSVPRSSTTSCSRTGRTSPGSPRPGRGGSGRGSSSAGWGRPRPAAPARPAPPSPTCWPAATRR